METINSVGTISFGVRTPILREGDDLKAIVVEYVMKAYNELGFSFEDGDIIGITESLVARTQGNYISTADIINEIKNKFNKRIGIVYPILSRNRFGGILKGISKAVEGGTVLLDFPKDEVGNELMTTEEMISSGVDINKIYTREEFNEIFKDKLIHKFTGINYLDYYKEIAPNMNIILSRNPLDILKYEKNDAILLAGIHRKNTDKKLFSDNNIKVFDLSDLFNEPTSNHGYNEQYGLLGANLAGEDRQKLFPKNGDKIVTEIQNILKAKTGALLEIVIFGDGAFKDPTCGIWELADPKVIPYYTRGGKLEGTPSEIKLKNVTDHGLTDEEIKIKIKNNENESQLGTTPRQITDLVGSLCDLTTGSGDKGTPVVVIKRYFKKYTDN